MSEASLFDTSALTSQPAPTASATHSLYRKYRPTTFADDDLVGQEHVVNTLRNAIVLDRISHAYLFCGPRGTGKTTTARLLAKAVNCLDPDPLKRPCNTCAACVAINTNATTDVIEIDAASNRGIDDIRDLRERVKYAPSQLKTKFYIVDEAHQITGAAANAFLKTLEEPPPHTKFILATTDPEELLQTIVSRCQRFDFRRINIDAMVSRLRNVADRERIRIEDDALPVISRQATGSLRDALGMLDQVAVYRESATGYDTPITAEMVRTVLGVSRNERVESLARSLADRDPAAGLREISAAVDAGDDSGSWDGNSSRTFACCSCKKRGARSTPMRRRLAWRRSFPLKSWPLSSAIFPTSISGPNGRLFRNCRWRSRWWKALRAVNAVRPPNRQRVTQHGHDQPNPPKTRCPSHQLSTGTMRRSTWRLQFNDRRCGTGFAAHQPQRRLCRHGSRFGP